VQASQLTVRLGVHCNLAWTLILKDVISSAENPETINSLVLDPGYKT
jgi:hypothetical protein